MSIFSKYPVIKDYKIGDQVLDVMDITRRTGILAAFRNDASTYVDYIIKDGETPIMLADRLYDDEGLYWVILMFNDIFDVENEWPLDTVSLDEYIDRLYEDPEAVYEYRSSYSGNVVDADHVEYDRVSITNRQYEYELNDAKRQIRVPIPESISLIVRDHNRLIQE